MRKNLRFEKWPKVSIIISNYNGLQLNLIIDSLTSVLNCDYPNYEVFLIDNASTDNSVTVVKRKFGKNKKLKIIRNSVNMYSQGLNLGIENSDGEYIVFFNNDIEFKYGYLQKIVNLFQKEPKAALVQGKLLYFYDHKIIDSTGETMDIYGNPITIGAWERDLGQYDRQTQILSASGSASVVRRSAVNIAGDFDQDFGIGYEDMDLALRLRLKGFKVLYLPDAVIYHKRGKTDLSTIIRVKVRWHFNKNRLATMIKNYPILLLIRALPMTILLYIVTGLWEIFIKRKFSLGLTRFTAIIWILRNISTLLKKRFAVRRDIKKYGEEGILNLLSDMSLFKGFLFFVKIK